MKASIAKTAPRMPAPASSFRRSIDPLAGCLMHPVGGMAGMQ